MHAFKMTLIDIVLFSSLLLSFPKQLRTCMYMCGIACPLFKHGFAENRHLNEISMDLLFSAFMGWSEVLCGTCIQFTLNYK